MVLDGPDGAAAGADDPDTGADDLAAGADDLAAGADGPAAGADDPAAGADDPAGGADDPDAAADVTCLTHLLPSKLPSAVAGEAAATGATGAADCDDVLAAGKGLVVVVLAMPVSDDGGGGSVGCAFVCSDAGDGSESAEPERSAGPSSGIPNPINEIT